MDAASGLQRFQSVLAGPRTDADLAKVIVELNQPGGESHQVELRPPLNPSGGFHGAIFGRSQGDIDTEKASSVNGNGAATQGIVKDFNARGRSQLSESGAVTGEAASTPRTTGAPARTPAQLHGDIASTVDGLLDSQRLVNIALEGGTQATLSRQLLTDSNRGEYSVNGKLLTVPKDQNGEPDKDAFAAAFRASFPAGEKGDRLALLASACMNQFCLNPTMEYVGVNASLTPAKAGADLLSYDAWQRDDGSWGIRCAMLRQFDRYIDHASHNDIVETPGRCTCLWTVEYTIDVTAVPRLAQVATDIVFSGKVGR